MPISNPTDAVLFAANYPVISEYVTDDERIPYFNPANSGVMILPGEPIPLVRAGAQVVFLAQGPIRPGETGYLVRNFTADFPCILSGNVLEGTPIWWDTSVATVANPVGVAKLEADAVTGYPLGVASYVYFKKPLPALSGTQVICGTTASTMIRIVSVNTRPFGTDSVTAAAAQGVGNTILPGLNAVNVTGVTVGVNDFVVLPALASVPNGFTLTMVGAAASNFEVRTPAASTERINNVVSHGPEEYLFTNTQIVRFVKYNNTVGWVAQGITALGAAVAAVVPD